MIAQLSGKVVALGANWVVLDVGGVGFKVSCPPGTAAGLRPAGEAALATSLIVREDSMTLYGFTETSERDAFELLQTSSGVGPRIALATVSVLSPAQLVAAIRAEDLNTLTKVPGVGRKGAQKMVLEVGKGDVYPIASLRKQVDDGGAVEVKVVFGDQFL